MKFRLLPLIFIFFICANLRAETVSFTPQGVKFIPKSDLIYKVLKIVDRLYVDNKRVVPRKMLEGSLEQLSFNIAPALIRSEYDRGEARLYVSVDQFNKTFKFDLPKNVNALNDILQEIAKFIKPRLEEGEKRETVDYAIINGFLKTLDPHSSFLIPEVYSEFSAHTSGNFGGIGITIGIRNGNLTVISPIDGTPAQQVGLKANDHIVQINEESTINMPLSEAVKRLRGKAKTEVDVYIMRKGFASPKKYPIVRDIIKMQSVHSHVFQEGDKRVGFLKVNNFQQNTMSELNEYLEAMDYNLNDFQGLIIDLRNNPGGLLEQAIKVSDHFLDKGVIVSTAGVRTEYVRDYKAHWWDRDIVDIPIVILVNEGSASASEIVAAALKNNKRALVAGLQTFGKGSVQQLIPFRGGSALRLTTSKYLTPGKISIQSVGVAPDIEVVPRSISQNNVYISSPELYRREKSLERNFAEWGDKAESPEKTIFYISGEETENGRKKEKEKEHSRKTEKEKFELLKKDFLTKMSIDILLENEKKDYDYLLKTALRHVRDLERQQEEKLIEKFASFTPPIDWKLGKTTGKEKITARSWLEIKTKRNGQEKWKKHSSESVFPGDELRLHLEVENIGKHAIPRLMAVSEAKNLLFNDRQFIFGNLSSGKSAEWRVPIQVPNNSVSRSNLINFNFLNQEKNKIHRYSMSLEIKEKERPYFHYQLLISDNGEHDSKGNGDGIIQVGETIVAEVPVANRGKGKSGELQVLLKSGEGKNIFLIKGRHGLKPLPPGKTESAFFKFDLKKEPEDGDLDFSLDIFDGSFYQNSVNQKIKIPLGRKVDKIANSAPEIRLDSRGLVSRRKAYELKAVVKDDSKVKDVYVFNNEKKIYYKNFQSDNRDQARFTLNIDLEKGNNRIIIVARDDRKVSARKEIYIRLEK